MKTKVVIAFLAILFSASRAFSQGPIEYHHTEFGKTKPCDLEGSCDWRPVEKLSYIVEKDGCKATFIVEAYWRPNCDANGTATQIIQFFQISGYSCNLTFVDAMTQIQIQLWEFVRNKYDSGMGLFNVSIASCIDAGYLPGPVEVTLPKDPGLGFLKVLDENGIKHETKPNSSLIVKIPKGGLFFSPCSFSSSCCAQSFIVEFSGIKPDEKYKRCAKFGMYRANGLPDCEKNPITGGVCESGCNKLNINYPNQYARESFNGESTTIQCSVAPNPNDGEFVFNIVSGNNSIANIKLTTLSGEAVYQSANEIQKGENSIKTNLRSLPSGLYLYSIEIDGEILTGRVSITK